MQPAQSNLQPSKQQGIRAPRSANTSRGRRGRGQITSGVPGAKTWAAFYGVGSFKADWRLPITPAPLATAVFPVRI
jgi:hypothetical protein